MQHELFESEPEPGLYRPPSPENEAKERARAERNARLQELVGKIVLCANGHIRRLLRIESNLVIYEVPFGDRGENWMELSPTVTSYVAQLFFDGTVYSTLQEALNA